MSCLRIIDVNRSDIQGKVYITDDAQTAKELKAAGEAVIVYLHEGNRHCDFSGFTYAVENIADVEEEYALQILQRHLGLPWDILDTKRCHVRETTVADVDSFYAIYADPSITEYTEGLFDNPEDERQYAKDYIDKIYTFYGYGVWTIVSRITGDIIGRAGFSERAGYDTPELGFVIDKRLQRQGYAFEVCSAILEYGFRVLEFEQVHALVEPDNTASIALLEKLGFLRAETTRMNDKTYYVYRITKQ